MQGNLFASEALVKAAIADRLREAEQARLAQLARQGRAAEPTVRRAPTGVAMIWRAAWPKRAMPVSERGDAA